MGVLHDHCCTCIWIHAGCSQPSTRSKEFWSLTNPRAFSTPNLTFIATPFCIFWYLLKIDLCWLFLRILRFCIGSIDDCRSSKIFDPPLWNISLLALLNQVLGSYYYLFYEIHSLYKMIRQIIYLLSIVDK